jgi:hypothetical protein
MTDSIGMTLHADTPEGVSPQSAAGDAAGGLARELRRLDPYSFWTLPAPDAALAGMIVAGTTGVYLLSACDLPGLLRLGKRPVIGDAAVPIRSLRASAKKLASRLSAAGDFGGVEPVVVLDRAIAGAPTSSGGVRFVKATDLVADLTARPRALSRERAQQAARLLGVELAGDASRHFAIRR